MKVFNIGPMELLIIVTIALIFLGPEGMVSASKSIAKEIRKLITSPIWASIMDTSKEIREIPKKFLQESGLDESIKEFSQIKSETEKEIFSIGKQFQGHVEHQLDAVPFPELPIEDLEQPTNEGSEKSD